MNTIFNHFFCFVVLCFLNNVDAFAQTLNIFKDQQRLSEDFGCKNFSEKKLINLYQISIPTGDGLGPRTTLLKSSDLLLKFQLLVGQSQSASKYKIIIYHSALKAQEIYSSLPPSFSFSPRTVGAHRISVMEKTTQGQCNDYFWEFTLTDNPIFTTPQASNEKLNEELDTFHLNMLNAQNFWPTAMGGGAVVAVIDSGVNYNHPDLRQKIYTNFGEIPGNNIDDDHNGYKDDVHGWDFKNKDAYPFDDNGHGTHVSGLIAGAKTGLAPNLYIMPLKVLDPFGYASFEDIKAAINYAVSKNVRIINLSIGGNNGTREEYYKQYNEIFNYCNSMGVMLVTASGNGGADGIGDNNDLPQDAVDHTNGPYYPSSLGNANVLSVAAVDENFVLADYSNYGKKTVDVAAPGGTIKRLLISASHLCDSGVACYKGLSGTSMAVPLVSATLGVMVGMKPTIPIPEMIRLLMKTPHPKTSQSVLDHIRGPVINPSEIVKKLSPR